MLVCMSNRGRSVSNATAFRCLPVCVPGYLTQCMQENVSEGYRTIPECFPTKVKSLTAWCSEPRGCRNFLPFEATEPSGKQHDYQPLRPWRRLHSHLGREEEVGGKKREAGGQKSTAEKQKACPEQQDLRERRLAVLEDCAVCVQQGSAVV